MISGNDAILVVGLHNPHHVPHESRGGPHPKMLGERPRVTRNGLIRMITESLIRVGEKNKFELPSIGRVTKASVGTR